MPATTVTKMKTVKELPSLRRPATCKDKSRKRKRRMSSQRLDAAHPGGDSAAAFSARVKRFHSKSRRGCYTCRQRRVKCDEQRTPNCLRCDKGGYVCEWQDARGERSGASENRPANVTRTTSYVTQPLDDDDEAGTHSFFSEGTVANVSSLFVDMAESFAPAHLVSSDMATHMSKFYYKFVFQASRSSPIVRKTLTALRGLYERVRSRDASPGQHEYIHRYSEAVTDLRTSSIELPPDIFLIASVLFANCEYLMGDLCSAVRHLRAGARILQAHSDRNVDDESLWSELSETLSIIFQAFDHDPIVVDCPTPGSDYIETVAEVPFDTLSQANDTLLQMYNHTFALRRVGYKHPRHIAPAAQDFQRLSGAWLQRVTALEPSLELNQLPWLQLLQGQHTALDTVVDFMSNTTPEISCDGRLDDLILQISTFLETCASTYTESLNIDRPYQENIGLILPLLLVTLHSTDAQTCETALSLLGRVKISEGVLNSCCAHSVGRAVVNARHTMRYSYDPVFESFDNQLPVADIKRVTELGTGTELDITIAFVSSSNESNAIVGGFCPTGGTLTELCRVLEGGGFQGAVSAEALPNCTCYELM